MLDHFVREQFTTVAEAWLLVYDLSTHIKSIAKKRETDGRRQKEGRGVGVVGRRDARVPSLSPLYSVWTPAHGMVPLTFGEAHLP